VAISFTAGGATVAANLQGADVVLLGATIDSLPFELWSIPSIKTPEQLKGTKLGVSRLGATTDFVARYLLKRWNLQPDKDVAIFQTGSGPQIFAAIKGGSVQSGVLSTGPETLSAEAAGYLRLADVSTSGLVYPFGPFAARQAFLKNQPDLALRFTKAYVEGLHRFKTDKTAALGVLEKYTKQKSTPAAEKIYEIYASRYFKRAPEATPAAIQTILEELSASRPLPPGIAPQRFAESRFIRELVASGFVDALYKSR
jgi:NitT/TauT family transport system substrate-binding protein